MNFLIITGKVILICILLLFLISAVSFAQTRARTDVNFPDIPGYKTLICDFHMHTVFSDGNVWPSIRSEEAWRQGLDAIAVTDHIENQPHKEDIPCGAKGFYFLESPRVAGTTIRWDLKMV
jgi:hypothetical protein